MTKTVSFKTAKGAEISITIVTERAKIADSTMMDACWEIEFEVNGKRTFGKRIDHDDVGPAISLDMGTRQEGKKVIAVSATAPIPADKLANVDALLAEFEAGVKARHEAWADRAKEDTAYDARRRFIASDGGAA